jgi:4-hydroxythreonine-4-phosphate dehydrogenase
MYRPLLAITTGHPAGVGPEIILKALKHAEVFTVCRPLVIGDERIFRRAAGWLGGSPLEIEIVNTPGAGAYNAGVLSLLDLHNILPAECGIGQVSAAAGKAAVEYVYCACDLALQKEVDGIVTAP